MTPEQFARITAVFEECLEAPEPQWDEVARRLSGDDDLVHRRALAMLRAHRTGDAASIDGRLTHHVQRAGAELVGAIDDEPLPDRIGAYTVVRRLGEGGMGVVYEATQASPSRTVAVKVLRASANTPALVRRFRREAEMLGRLAHPNIAHVHEVGVAAFDDHAERPFFAMQFVRGRPLTRAARDANLDVRARAALMLEVCAGVAHAHELGVVHRDLKPANILVDDEGHPRILDFGVARWLRPGETATAITQHTMAGQLVGTFPYVSPEQVGGNPAAVDERCDVYALGVLLYELFAGRLPIDVAGCSLPEAARRVCDEDPRPLSRVDPALRGDLETIVARAMEKDPSRRYAAVRDLADDLQRFLEHRPIRARPVTASYRAAKFVRRNRGLVAGFGAAIGVLVVGIAATTLTAIRADASARSERWATYTARIDAASNAIERGDVRGAAVQLAAAPEVHRNWEWRYLRRNLDRWSIRLDVGPDIVGDPCLVDDGRRMVVAHRSGNLVTWNLESGEVVSTLELGVPVVAFTGTCSGPGSGRAAVAGGIDGTIVMIDPLTGTIRHRFAGLAGPADRIAIDGEGPWLVAAADAERIAAWVIEPGEHRAVLERSVAGQLPAGARPELTRVRSLGVDAAGQRVAASVFAGSVRRTSVWSVGLDPVTESPVGMARGAVLALVPGDPRVVAAMQRRDLQVVEPGVRGSAVRLAGHEADPQAIAILPGGRHVASASPTEVLIHDLIDGRIMATFQLGSPVAMAGDPGSGRRADPGAIRGGGAATGDVEDDDEDEGRDDGDDEDDDADEDPDPGLDADSDATPTERPRLAAGRGGDLIATRIGSVVRVWDVRLPTATVLRGSPTYLYSAAMDGDGRVVAGAVFNSRSIRIWDGLTGTHLGVLRAPRGLTRLGFDDDGRLIAGGRRRVLAYDLDRPEGSRETNLLAEAVDPRRLAGVRRTRTKVRAHDGVRAAEVQPGNGQDRIVIRAADRDANGDPDGEVLQVFECLGRVRSVAFDRTDRWLAAGTEHGPVEIWDVRRGARVAELTGHRGTVYGVAFSPDGTRLASGGNDGSIRIWDTARWERVLELTGHASYVHDVTFSADGASIVSASGDRTVRIWRSRPKSEEQAERFVAASARQRARRRAADDPAPRPASASPEDRLADRLVTIERQLAGSRPGSIPEG